MKLQVGSVLSVKTYGGKTLKFEVDDPEVKFLSDGQYQVVECSRLVKDKNLNEWTSIGRYRFLSISRVSIGRARPLGYKSIKNMGVLRRM